MLGCDLLRGRAESLASCCVFGLLLRLQVGEFCDRGEDLANLVWLRLAFVVLDVDARIACPRGLENVMAGTGIARLAEVVLANLEQIIEVHLTARLHRLEDRFDVGRHRIYDSNSDITVKGLRRGPAIPPQIVTAIQETLRSIDRAAADLIAAAG